MVGYCNFIPDAVWIRGLSNGIRHITLRRNFTEETSIRQEGEELQYRFEETDVYIQDRDNLQEFITQNYGNLFDLGLQQTEANEIKQSKLQKTKQIIEDGSIIDEMQLLGQQITNMMLEV